MIRGTLAELIAANRVYRRGTVALVTDAGDPEQFLIIGDGVTPGPELERFVPQSYVDDVVVLYRSGRELAYMESAVSNASLSDVAVDLPTSPLAIAFATTARPAMIHVHMPQCGNDTATKGGVVWLTDAANTVLESIPVDSPTVSALQPVDLWFRLAAGTPLATYKVRMSRRGAGGTFTLGATAQRKMFVRAVEV